MHGQQNMAYKAIKYLNKQEKDTLKLNIIDENQWIEYYRKLWYDPSLADANFEEERQNKEIPEVDMLSIQELEEALKSCKNRKAAGIDSINIELFKYSGIISKHRFLHFLNMCWSQ